MNKSINAHILFFLTIFLDKKPSKEWPNKGQIIFNKLYLRYNPETPFVLKNITVTIEATEKVLTIYLFIKLLYYISQKSIIHLLNIKNELPNIAFK